MVTFFTTASSNAQTPFTFYHPQLGLDKIATATIERVFFPVIRRNNIIKVFFFLGIKKKSSLIHFLL